MIRSARVALATLLLAGLAAGAPAEAPMTPGPGWRPADGPLMTRWSKEVPVAQVRPPHPRPHMYRGNWGTLDGFWDYAILSKDDGMPEKWDGKILVPYPVESALSGVMKRVGAGDRLWYRYRGVFPSFPVKRRLLHFGAVDWDTTVWVNGKKAGTHRGGYDPFTLDITDLVKRSGVQEVIVSVWDPTDSGFQPRGKQVENPNSIWYTPTTGIWQTVWIEAVPETYIESVKVVPDVDRSQVVVTVNVRGPERGLRTWASAREGRGVLGTGQAPAGSPITLKIPEAKLWSPAEPFLYRLTIGLISEKKTVDSVTSYFAMRKISVGKDRNGVNRLMLNNRPVFQFGPLDQGFWPDGLYAAPNDDALRHDIDMAKALGFNMIRKHVKVEPARWYFWCDWLGIMVWQDMPSASVRKDGDGSAEEKENFRRELKSIVDALSHFQSIVMWVPFNEGWGQHDTAETAEWLKSYDPTRLVNCASGWHDAPGSGDVRDIHDYPGPKSADLEESRAIVLGEFGGLGLPVKGHTWQDEKNWGYRSFANQKELTGAYLNLVRKLRPLIDSGLSAAVYTQMTDVEIEVNGLMTYDRQEIKMNGQKVAEANREVCESLSPGKP